MRGWVSLVAVGALLAIAGCGGDDDDDDAGDATEAVADDTDDTGGAAAVPTSEELCELFTPAAVGEAFGADVESAQPGGDNTPYCNYAVGTGYVTVSVMRPGEDLPPGDIDDAFDAGVELVLSFMSESATTEELPGVGERATVLAGKNLVEVIAHNGEQTITVVGGADDDPEALGAVAQAYFDTVG